MEPSAFACRGERAGTVRLRYARTADERLRKLGDKPNLYPNTRGARFHRTGCSSLVARSMATNEDHTKQALIAVVELVAEIFNAEPPATLVEADPDVHDALFKVVTYLEALGYPEKQRGGYAATEH